MTSVEKYKALPKEIEMEATIRDAVEHKGGRVFSVRDSRKLNVEDMPDLLIILPPYVGLLELKSQKRKITTGQQAVIDLLEGCQFVVSGIVRPVPDGPEMSLDEALDLLGIEVS